MIADVIDLLACPRCAEPLQLPTPETLVCPTGHRTDLARQGHANLLSRPAPVNADTTAMVQARLDYLARGHHDAVRELLVQRSGSTVLDAGCGPGWYLQSLPGDTRVVGLDLSVAAVRRAARTHPRVGALVTDLRDPLPVVDAAVDTAWSVFAPRPVAELARVVRPGGTLLVVLPAPDHLTELVRAGVVIGQQADKEQRVVTQLDGLFEPVDRRVTRSTIPADPDVVAELVAMGPSAHHRPQASTVRVDHQGPREVTVSLVLYEFRR